MQKQDKKLSFFLAVAFRLFGCDIDLAGVGTFFEIVDHAFHTAHNVLHDAGAENQNKNDKKDENLERPESEQ